MVPVASFSIIVPADSLGEHRKLLINSVRGDVNSPAKLSGHMDENPTSKAYEIRLAPPLA